MEEYGLLLRLLARYINQWDGTIAQFLPDTGEGSFAGVVVESATVQQNEGDPVGAAGDPVGAAGDPVSTAGDPVGAVGSSVGTADVPMRRPLPGNALPAGRIVPLPDQIKRFSYVNGTFRLVLPFAVILRVDDASPRYRADVLDWFGALEQHLTNFALWTNKAAFGRCKMTEYPARTSENGTAAEYRAAFGIEMRSFAATEPLVPQT